MPLTIRPPTLMGSHLAEQEGTLTGITDAMSRLYVLVSMWAIAIKWYYMVKMHHLMRKNSLFANIAPQAISQQNGIVVNGVSAKVSYTSLTSASLLGNFTWMCMLPYTISLAFRRKLVRIGTIVHRYGAHPIFSLLFYSIGYIIVAALREYPFAVLLVVAMPPLLSDVSFLIWRSMFPLLIRSFQAFSGSNLRISTRSTLRFIGAALATISLSEVDFEDFFSVTSVTHSRRKQKELGSMIYFGHSNEPPNPVYCLANKGAGNALVSACLSSIVSQNSPRSQLSAFPLEKGGALCL